MPSLHQPSNERPAACARCLIAGATGYMGSRLAPRLLARGHEVVALARAASRSRVPCGCVIIEGDACDADSYTAAAQGIDTIVHLVGVAHPSPAKAAEFRSIDLASARAAAHAAQRAAVRHLVYVSVAQPAPAMHAYVAARSEAEATIRASGVAATFLRPWYVLGPGHRWPLALLPAYWVMELLPPTRATAQRLGLVTLDEMLRALVHAVEHPAASETIIDVPAIRALARARLS